MTDRAAVADWAWHDTGLPARITRATLSPASALFGAIVGRRNRAYDRGEGVLPTAVPALSVGNLTVGGTGKTPVAAWCAAELARLGARPAIVLRGYGDDEPRVHELLNPGTPVITDADRVAGAARAVALHADVVVLDDAFQHRRASRVVDLVLISADRWRPPVRLLPTGPWREPLTALRRASVVVVTCKAPAPHAEDAVREAVARAAPQVPQAVVSLVPSGLRRLEPEMAGASSAEATSAEASSAEAPSTAAAAEAPMRPLDSLRGERVLAISGIGDPAAFESQLRSLGAEVDGRRFPDHHSYSVAEAAQLARAVPASGVALCTLKDAVKLAPYWPRAAPPLWYVSQTIEVRLGSEVLQSALARVLAARTPPDAPSSPTAG